MKSLSLFLIFSLIYGSGPFSWAERRPREEPKPTEERRKQEEERKKAEEARKKAQEEGHCQGACESIRTGEELPEQGRRRRPVENKTELDELITKAAAKSPGVEAQVKQTLEQQFNSFKEAPEAKAGLEFLISEFVKSRDKGPSEREGSFLTSLIKRMNGNLKDKLEDLKKLVCPQDCGNKGMVKSCRIMAKLLRDISKIVVPAGATLTAISVNQAVASISNPGSKGPLEVTLSFEKESTKEKSTQTLKFDDTPEAAEEVSVAQETN